MAKNLITTNILGSVKAPLTKAALDTLQANFKEIPASIARGVLGSYTTGNVIIWEGFIITLSTVTTTNDTATWTAGTVYYNGEFYQVTAGTLTKTSGVFLYSIIDSLITAQFSDGNSYNWLETKTITITSGTSGTGIADYAAATVKRLTDILSGKINTTLFTYQNGYSDGGLVGSVGKFKIDNLGNVKLIGLIAAPSTVTSDIFIMLPFGFTPSTPKVFATATYFSLTSGGVFCNIATNGTCRINNYAGAFISGGANFCLDGINFNVND